MNKWPGKSRPWRRPQGRHGKVKRIVGDTPMITFREALKQDLDREMRELEARGIVGPYKKNDDHE
jgi:ribosomal protein L32E